MKNTSEYGVQELQHDDLTFVNGGSEFSESFVKSVGWVVGALGGMWESFVRNQEEMYKRGLHPAI